ncbi:ABC transporter ATP-binding protein [Sulfurimonas sp.]|uniref:ABC transporter ATP-binding protein n=1 Tax=Sulfurimonas sp. TaxID=2022749 RepID=UPI0025E25BC0|nr:ABC transporter ATP-binding protein [Sulfurimonas sp.]
MIELKNITKKYEINKNNVVTALQDIDMKIQEGELVVLKGASGSGKSSVLSLIAALSKPTSGEVIVDAKHISKLPDNFASEYRRDNIGFIFQNYNLIPTLSVKENILLPLVPLNPDAKVANEKLNRVMEMFKINHKADSIIKNLSGGEQQRVAIARANVNDPKIIIADEPTANLDEKLSLHFIEMLRELKSLKKTIVVATHDPLFFDLDFVDRTIEMHNGVLV